LKERKNTKEAGEREKENQIRPKTALAFRFIN